MNVKSVEQLNIPELEVYVVKNEAQLRHFYEPKPGLFIAETANVILRALKAGYVAESMLIDEKILADAVGEDGVAQSSEDATEAQLGKDAVETQLGDGTQTPENPENELKHSVREIVREIGEVPIYAAPYEVISKINGFTQTRGVLAAMRRKPLPTLEEISKGAKRIAVLEDVENPTNVGAIFRSAAALGIDAIVLTHGSADPLYRRAARVSMGGVYRIPWTFAGSGDCHWTENEADTLKKAGFKLVSMALSKRAIPLDSEALKREEKTAILFGNEEFGLTKQALEKSDYIAVIPMAHEMDSLNVAAAAAVTFWELRK